MIVQPLEAVGAGDLGVVGGKGANLGEMVRAGLPVPPGFCITAAAYRRFVDENDLWPTIEAALARVAVDDIAALESAAEAIRAALEAAPLPAEVAAAAAAAYAELGSPPVAVRSSATAEDLPQASFAGQQETYLNVRGESALLLHARRCWASLWTARAIAYRARNDFSHASVSLAVVVQAMVEPETAGVLFTANPISGNRDEMVVNAAYGLGESVVSGRVTPDTYRIAKGKRPRLLHQSLGAKEIRIRSAAAGGAVAEPVPERERRRFCLNRGDLERLAAMGLQVEAHYGAPQDIEWAIANHRVYLLQARPITSLGAPVPDQVAGTRRLSRVQRMILDDILEHYPDPPYPLDYEAVTGGYDTLQQAVRDAGFALPPATNVIRMDELGIPTVAPAMPRPTLRLLTSLWRLRASLRRDAREWLNGQAAHFGVRLTELRAVDLAGLDDASLAVHIRRAVDLARELGCVRFSQYVIPMPVRGGLLAALIRLAGTSREVQTLDLLSGLDYKTAEIERALVRLAHAAAAAPEVRALLLDLPPDQALAALEATDEGRAFLGQLSAFLEAYGARATKMYLAFSTRSWAEEPTVLIASLAGMLRAGDPAEHEERVARAEQRFAQLRDRVVQRLPGPLARVFLRTLEQYRAGHVAREDTLFRTEEALAVARSASRLAGRRLAETGALAEGDQVVFLTLTELEHALDGRLPPPEVQQLVARRQAARPAALAAWRGREYGADNVAAGDLSGQPGSPGLAKGPARVIAGPSDFGKLRQGDVLVCPFTDPTWTPLFSLAAAVVADTGGPLSHAAIVAREYGIPAVLGTRFGTSRLKDGELVTVDGNRGLVARLDP